MPAASKAKLRVITVIWVVVTFAFAKASWNLAPKKSHQGLAFSFLIIAVALILSAICLYPKLKKLVGQSERTKETPEVHA